MKNQAVALKKRASVAIILIATCGAALAQMSPAGKWYSADDKTGELKSLVERERPEVVRTVSWAASNGDRSARVCGCRSTRT